MHQYRLMYGANEFGMAKRTEFAAPWLSQAIEIALSDPCARTVDIWENGEFMCRLSRGRSGKVARHFGRAPTERRDA
jgi:hypothetical protein